VADPSIDQGFNIHVGVAGGRLVDIGLVDDEEDLKIKRQTALDVIYGCAPRGE
jgi:hypothetical protein